MDSKTVRSNVRWGVIALGLITALIHLKLHFGIPGDILFLLNGLGYLAILVAYVFPIPIAKDNHNLVRYLFIAYTAVTILAWLVMGMRSALGYLTKLDEVLLMIALFYDKD